MEWSIFFFQLKAIPTPFLGRGYWKLNEGFVLALKPSGRPWYNTILNFFFLIIDKEFL